MSEPLCDTLYFSDDEDLIPVPANVLLDSPNVPHSKFQAPKKRCTSSALTPVTEKKQKVAASAKEEKINFVVAHCLVYRKGAKPYHPDEKNTSAGDYFGHINAVCGSKEALRKTKMAAIECVKDKQLSLFFQPASSSLYIKDGKAFRILKCEDIKSGKKLILAFGSDGKKQGLVQFKTRVAEEKKLKNLSRKVIISVRQNCITEERKSLPGFQTLTSRSFIACDLSLEALTDFIKVVVQTNEENLSIFVTSSTKQLPLQEFNPTSEADIELFEKLVKTSPKTIFHVCFGGGAKKETSSDEKIARIRTTEETLERIYFNESHSWFHGFSTGHVKMMVTYFSQKKNFGKLKEFDNGKVTDVPSVWGIGHYKHLKCPRKGEYKPIDGKIPPPSSVQDVAAQKEQTVRVVVENQSSSSKETLMDLIKLNNALYAAHAAGQIPDAVFEIQKQNLTKKMKECK